MKHVMLDLETLGTKPGCAILSIGAIEFDSTGLGSTYYRVILNPVGAIDSSTVLWWLKQSDAARRAITEPNMNTHALHGVAINDFYNWFRSTRAKHVWSHGASFDEPIIRHAAGMEIEPPWKFWDARCTRTAYDMAGVSVSRANGIAHTALDDARNQAIALIGAYQKLGLTL